MRLQPKRDSSYASNRLTRSNRPTRHLLSTYNQPQDYKPGGEREVESKRKAPEPATSDEPLSSSEIDSPPSSDGERGRKTLGEKLADGDQDASPSLPTPRSGGVGYRARKPPSSSQDSGSSQKRTAASRKGDLTRTISNLVDDNDDDELFPSFRSSQSFKRNKPNTYPSKYKSASYARVPSSSARSTVTSPERAERESKSSTKKRKDKKANKSSDEPDMVFKVPMEIEAPSPRKPRVGIGSTEFKLPPTFPNDSISSSSMGTTSTKDLQPMVFDDDSPLSSISTPLSSPSWSDFEALPREERLAGGEDRPPSPPRKALCPMCKAEVDPEMLTRFEAQPNQRIREQQQFCASHRQLSAEKEWQAHGYPDINWDSFDQRVQNHFPDLEKLLVPECSSYYRNRLDSTFKSGKAKNFRLTLTGEGLETISCGYYGTKGAGKMLQVVMDRFALKLRRLATSDHIVKTAGVAGYAQSVLVPELAVRLVKEDMGVTDESARQILRESIDLGEKLNPALNDVVPIPDEAEEVPQD